MKVFWAVGISMLALGACGGVEAAPSDYSDIIVVSVVPRSPTVQPIVMNIPAKEQPEPSDSLKRTAFDAQR